MTAINLRPPSPVYLARPPGEVALGRLSPALALAPLFGRSCSPRPCSPASLASARPCRETTVTGHEGTKNALASLGCIQRVLDLFFDFTFRLPLIMRRGRGKGRKYGAVVTHEDAASGGEESLPSYKRKGWPSKPLKEEPNEEENEKIEEEDDSAVKLVNFTKEMNSSSTVEDKEKKEES